MEKLTIVKSKAASLRLEQMVSAFTQSYASSAPTLLLALELDDFGRDETLYELLKEGYDPNGKRGAVLISAPGDLYTKTILSEQIHLLNYLGMSFPGTPYVEATGSLSNQRKLARLLGVSPHEALLRRCAELGERVSLFQPRPLEKLLVIHANSRPEKSNTMTFFQKVREYLDPEIQISVEIIEEDIRDCRGCSYLACGYYQEGGGCFYGSVFNEAFLEKVIEYDAILWLAPNYNDALSAKIMAIINRFSALYKQAPFYDKSLYALIVSGNSGSDAVARQLIGALCLNKGFGLPAKFYAQHIANDPGEILTLPGLEESARQFARRLNRCAKNGLC